MLWMFVFILFGFFLVIVAIDKFEKEKWNNGICKESNQPWILIKTTMVGDNIYTDNCGNYLTVIVFNTHLMTSKHDLTKS